MSFHARLLEQTASAREGLLATPIIQGCLRGEVSLPSYLAFLREAYHHVRHTVPLLEATQAALPGRHAWLRGPLDEYIDEETGHEEWMHSPVRPGSTEEIAAMTLFLCSENGISINGTAVSMDGGWTAG